MTSVTREFNRSAAKVVTMASLAHAERVETALAVAASKTLGGLSSWAIAAVDAILNPRALNPFRTESRFGDKLLEI